MMSEDSPLTVDFTQKDAALLLMPCPPLLTSNNAGWNSIQLEHHCQPACEIPEIRTSQHIISIRLSKTLDRLAVTHRGNLHQMRGEQEATVSIFPGYQDYKVGWSEEVEFVHCYLDPHLLNHTAYELMKPEGVEIGLKLAFNDSLIHQVALALKRELETHEAGSRLYAEAAATFLSVHLLQNYSNRNVLLQEYRGGLPKYKLHEAIDYIHAHLAEDISVDAIAQHLGFSRYYFLRSFKQAMGITPYQYVLQQRIERAKMLLRERNKSISQIALECGFADQNHFNKIFRKITGTTAKTYRDETY